MLIDITERMTMTRGFVTIATGAERYFDIAKNFVWSYQQ